MGAEGALPQRSREAGHGEFAMPPDKLKIVSFALKDPDNPVNWSSVRSHPQNSSCRSINSSNRARNHSWLL